MSERWNKLVDDFWEKMKVQELSEAQRAVYRADVALGRGSICTVMTVKRARGLGWLVSINVEDLEYPRLINANWFEPVPTE
jgi:hypothetical protein